MRPPLIGITADNRENSITSGHYESALAYSRAVAVAGGVPIILPHEIDLAGQYVQRCDGLMLTGGVDPDTSEFGEPMHEKARPMDARRQAFELLLLRLVQQRKEQPVLGVCLGMQLMALNAGGKLQQYLPDVLPEAAVHQDDRQHPLVLCCNDSVLLPEAESPGEVVSWHRQAVESPGSLRVVARAPDGVIEAVDDPDRPFYLGVQWHPERGGDGPFNLGLVRRFVASCQSAKAE